jgi:hypothetical protein
MHERTFSKSGSGSRSSQSDSAILHTSSTPQQATSSQANDEHSGAANNNVDIILESSQDSQVLYGASFDPHHYNDQDNTTTSLLHVPVGHGVGSASQMGLYTSHHTDHSQYSPTPTASTWGTCDQYFITCSDTPIQYDTSSNYQDNQVQLQQWAYQTSNSHLTVAERLEKSNWETKRHEKL